MTRALVRFMMASARWLISGRRGNEMPLNVEYRVASLSPTWRLTLRWVVPALRAAGLVALVGAAVGPGDFEGSQVVDSQGIAIELVVDRSGSMMATDYRLDGHPVSRLEAVRVAAERFVLGDSTSSNRNADSIGLVTFAAQAEVGCPLTIDHEAVVAELERTGAAADYREDGTAIGDAWALAVAQLHSLERSLAKEAGGHRLTKVAILLTDGQNNAGRRTPERAADLARRCGVRSYVVGLEAQQVSGVAAQKRVIAERERLRPLVAATGGGLYTVADTRSLEKVYAEIDALERSKVGEQTLATRRHWAVSAFEIGPFGFPPLTILALIALAAESALAWTLFLEAP